VRATSNQRWKKAEFTLAESPFIAILHRQAMATVKLLKKALRKELAGRLKLVADETVRQECKAAYNKPVSALLNE
jgi:sarcosine oxidase gamma subunit